MEKGALIGAGRTADVYAWGDERILKLYQDGFPTAAIEREFAITRLAREAGLPVPATEEMLQVDGRLGIVFERIRGTSLLKILESRPWELIAISRLLAEYHAKMHARLLPPDTFSQREQIERGIAWAKDLSEKEKQGICSILARCPEENAVCHGDFHPDNILMTDHGPVIIDWMTGSRWPPAGRRGQDDIAFRDRRPATQGAGCHAPGDQCLAPVDDLGLPETLSARSIRPTRARSEPGSCRCWQRACSKSRTSPRKRRFSWDASAARWHKCWSSTLTGNHVLSKSARRNIIVPMPELPELEVVCAVLNRRIVGQVITDVKVVPPGGPIVVRDLTHQGFEACLTGARVAGIARRGKFLIFSFLAGPPAQFLAINPKLTGRLQLAAPTDKRLAKTHVVFTFADGRQLRYVDQKQMGQLYLTHALESIPDYAGLGPEPFDLSLEEFRERLKPYRGEIKGMLTRGEFIAGIGNAYADEILWAARLHPVSQAHPAHCRGSGAAVRGHADYIVRGRRKGAGKRCRKTFTSNRAIS